jgi:hypothetical protein
MKSTSKKPGRKQKAAGSKAQQAKPPTKAPKSREVVPQEAGGKEPAPEALGDRLSRDIKELGPSFSHSIQQAVDRWGKRHMRFGAKLSWSDEGTGTLSIKPDFGGNAGFEFRRMDAFGTSSGNFAAQAMERLAGVARRQGQSFPTERELNTALAFVDGIRPENEVEATLAMQMYTAQDAAMEMMERMRQATTIEAMQNYGAMATKMMRTYTTQVEALNKLRRGGEQTVRVEHVHVHQGGQAIVGNVTHHPQGGGDKRKDG